MEKPVKMKLKKGDEVVVIAGKNRGVHGQVAKVNPAKNTVVVSGVNVVKKATKPNPQTGEEGGMITKELPINASNVMRIGADGKPTRKKA